MIAATTEKEVDPDTCANKRISIRITSAIRQSSGIATFAADAKIATPGTSRAAGERASESERERGARSVARGHTTHRGPARRHGRREATKRQLATTTMPHAPSRSWNRRSTARDDAMRLNSTRDGRTLALVRSGNRRPRPRARENRAPSSDDPTARSLAKTGGTAPPLSRASAAPVLPSSHQPPN